LTSLLPFLAAVSSATPIDSAWDVFDAVEYRRGDAFLELLSKDVRTGVDQAWNTLRGMALEDPVLAGAFLERMGLEIELSRLEPMAEDDFVSLLLGSVALPRHGEVVSESVSMRGENALVTFSLASGGSIVFDFHWEDTGWKLTGSSLLSRLFQPRGG